MSSLEPIERRILILAPVGRDTEVISGVVAGVVAAREGVDNIQRLMSEIGRGAAAAIVSEEALSQGARALALDFIQSQPPWSDFPFVVLLAKRAGPIPEAVKSVLSALGNVVLLERPLSADTLASAAASAIRARARQYDAREVLTQREAAADQLACFNRDLESRVDERTRALAQANDRLLAEVLERERAQKAVVQAQKLEALGRITGGVAHDFNNVLSVIMGNVELIAMVSPDAKIKARASAAQAACKRGAKLTSQLLSFARNQSLHLQSLSISDLFENVGELARPILGPRIELVFHLDDDVSSVVGDPSQLEMALLNLAINSRDAMGGAGRVIFHANRSTPPEGALPEGSYVRIAVADNGVGMSPEVAAKVFEPFFTTKGVGKGTGLGLSQVYGMAEQSGGAVYVRSRLGKGTVIEIWLRAAQGLPASEQPVAFDKHALAGLKVLVVEDDPAVRAGIVDALLTLGCDVSQASGGAEGVAALASET